MNRPLDSTLETPQTCPRIGVHLFFCDSNIPANVFDQLAGLDFAKYPNDLFFTESGLPHGALLGSRLSFSLDQFSGSTSASGQ